MKIELWTDGSGTAAGAGGWAFVLQAIDEDEFDEVVAERFGSGWVTEATNNRMELMALLEGLRALERPATVHVFTDSEYVMNPFVNSWFDRWIRKEWRKIKNPDLWQAILAAAQHHRLVFTHVEGHSGVELNEECDALAGMARRFAIEAMKEDKTEVWPEAMALAGAIG